MIRRPILTIAMTSFLISLTLFVSIVTNENVQANLFGNPIPIAQGLILSPSSRVDSTDASELSENMISAKTGDWSYCEYEVPEEPEFSFELLSTEIDSQIQGGNSFNVNFTFMNNSNSRVFSSTSECEGSPVLNLGTQMTQDRESIFGDNSHAVSGWTSSGRIKMASTHADPGEELEISFQSIAPEGNNIYREFFQTVIEGHGWTDGVFGIDIEIDEVSEQMQDDIHYVSHASIDAASLTGLERNLEINLSEQIMYAKFGDIPVWELQTSTGAWDTPTPTGSYNIFQKQELRIGGESPHYRMPWWQFWESSGYGIHALPYLGSYGGSFWEEAHNHIGTPVSHGCIRTLPADAEKLYKFTTIGTPLEIHY